MRRFTLASTLLGLLLLCAAGNALADHPTAGFGQGTAGPVTTIQASTIPQGSWSLGIRMEFVKFSVFSDAELEQFAAAGEEVDSTDYLLSPFLGAAYGVTDDITLSFNIPYAFRKDIREGHLDGGTPEVEAEGDSGGVGDTTLLAQYRFLDRPERGVEAAFLAGLKIPTGKTSERTAGDERFEAEHQPGSGSWDPLAGIALTKRLGFWSLDANLLYTLATKGSQDTDLGDLFNYNAAVSFRVGGEDSGAHSHDGVPHHPHGSHSHIALDLILEANGEWRGKQKVAGVRDDDSGGTLLYLSPGVRLTAGERCWGYLSVGIPVHEAPNGVQHEIDYRLIVGLGAAF